MKAITSEEYHDRICDGYDERHETPYWRLFHALTWHNLKRSLPGLPCDRPILDAGCGTGTWALRIAELGYHVIAVDSSQGMLDKAREKSGSRDLDGSIEIVRGDITSLERYEEGSMAMVVAEGDVLSYCSNHAAALSEMARLLAPGGRAILSVQNKLSRIKTLLSKQDFSALAELLATGRVSVPTGRADEIIGVYLFTPEDLNRMLRRCGLAAQKVIGKTVFAPFDDEALLEDETLFRRVLEIERMFGDEPHLLGQATHLEVVAVKAQI